MDMEAEGVELGDEAMDMEEREESAVRAKRAHVLPIRSTGKHESPPTLVVEPSPQEPTAPPADNDNPARSLRNINSITFGGAYNAHAFSKSLVKGKNTVRKGKNTVRGSLLDIDWSSRKYSKDDHNDQDDKRV